MNAADVKSTSCLHLLASADKEALESCAAHCQAGDTVLLIDAGVLQLMQAELAGLLRTGCRIHCLLNDLESQGIVAAVETTEVEPVDDAALPGLLRKHAHCLSWT